MTIAEIMFIKYSIYNEFNYDKQIECLKATKVSHPWREYHSTSTKLPAVKYCLLNGY